MMKIENRNKTYVLLCSGGAYYERQEQEPQKTSFSAVITIYPDQTSSLVIGSQANPAIGHRSDMHFDGLMQEKDEAILTGFHTDKDPETGDYWSLYMDEGWVQISLKDMVLAADECISRIA